MRFWRYHGPSRQPVLEDSEASRTEGLNEVMQRIVGSVPRKLGPAEVEFHVIQSPRAYDTEEMGLDMERLAGVLQADILVLKHRGEGAAHRLADHIGNTLTRRNSDGIRFGQAEVGPGHDFKDDKWRIQVSCPWHVDILSARN